MACHSAQSLARPARNHQMGQSIQDHTSHNPLSFQMEATSEAALLDEGGWRAHSPTGGSDSATSADWLQGA